VQKTQNVQKVQKVKKSVSVEYKILSEAQDSNWLYKGLIKMLYEQKLLTIKEMKQLLSKAKNDRIDYE